MKSSKLWSRVFNDSNIADMILLVRLPAIPWLHVSYYPHWTLNLSLSFNTKKKTNNDSFLLSKLNLIFIPGIGVDTPDSTGMNLIKKRGKVKALEDEIASSKFWHCLLLWLAFDSWNNILYLLSLFSLSLSLSLLSAWIFKINSFANDSGRTTGFRSCSWDSLRNFSHSLGHSRSP